MDDRFAARVGARLETSVTDVGLAIKIELLSEIVAGSVGGVCDGEWECNISEAKCGDVGYAPRYADESHGEGGQKRSRRGDE